ncbi:hypothetical protein TNCV_921291 [Trichonephila clavipes]|nr:hypothetical protein TNCV_921291 [Trichonephila clavipes]
MYRVANGNDRAALRLYQERFRSRRMPKHKMFQLLHRELCENDSFISNTGGRGQLKTVYIPGRSHVGPCELNKANSCNKYVSEVEFRLSRGMPAKTRTTERQRNLKKNLKIVATLTAGQDETKAAQDEMRANEDETKNLQ